MPFPRHGPRITIVQSKHITIGIAKIDHLDIAFEDAFFDDQLFEFKELSLPSLFGQSDRDTARKQQIPSPLSNALDRLQARLNRLLTGQRVDADGAAAAFAGAPGPAMRGSRLKRLGARLTLVITARRSVR